MRPAEEPDDALTSVVDALAASARRANLARAAVVAEVLDAAVRDAWTDQQREAAERAAHQVVGSAGTFGDHTASAAAARLEAFFRDGGTGPDELGQAREQLRLLLADLGRGQADAE